MFFDILDYNDKELKKKIMINLNMRRKKIQNELFTALETRKPGNLVFLQSTVREKIENYK